jgi:biopolymer transport protein ExbD
MMRKRKRRRSPMAAMDQINVTPLLDLTFLLLIAFMITMPLMEYGTEVDAPDMNSGELPTENTKRITLTKSGSIMVEKDTVSREELLPILRKYKGDNPKMQLQLCADGANSYKEVIELMALIRNGGFSDIILVTHAESKPQ